MQYLDFPCGILLYPSCGALSNTKGILKKNSRKIIKLFCTIGNCKKCCTFCNCEDCVPQNLPDLRNVMIIQKYAEDHKDEFRNE